MTDMLVKLYAERPDIGAGTLGDHGIVIRRALAIDKTTIVDFIRQTFSDICPGWADECEVSLGRQPSACFIAIRASQVIGFACYDATAKGMIGPMGVAVDYRKLGIATQLLHQCLEAMKMEGYAYAIIGWVSSEAFYAKACNALVIPDSFPGVYERMIEHN